MPLRAKRDWWVDRVGGGGGGYSVCLPADSWKYPASQLVLCLHTERVTREEKAKQEATMRNTVPTEYKRAVTYKIHTPL